MSGRIRSSFTRLLDYAGLWGVVALFATVIGAIWLVAQQVLALQPPAQMTMAAGAPGSGYYAIAEQYRTVLARDGIELNILSTAGSVENARLLSEGAADTAILQGGVMVPDGPVSANALAAIFLEPLFVFHRSTIPAARDPAQWVGLRVAIGAPGSGTRAAVDAAMQVLGLRPPPGDLLVPIGGATAAEALLAGEIDAAVFVAPIEAPYLVRLLRDPEVSIAPLRDIEALTRRLTFVRSADIPPAGIDYAARIPSERIPLAAMVATLAARDDLHAALVNRMVRAAQEIHGGRNLLSSTLRFPSTEGLGLPMNTQAAAALSSDPNALERTLPFWLAAQVSRVALLLVPLLVLSLPLLRALPGLYALTMQARVWRRYRELLAIEQEATDSVMTGERRRELLARLEAIDSEARELGLPVRYRQAAYTLRLHIDLVRRKVLSRGEEPA